MGTIIPFRRVPTFGDVVWYFKKPSAAEPSRETRRLGHVFGITMNGKEVRFLNVRLLLEYGEYDGVLPDDCRVVPNNEVVDLLKNLSFVHSVSGKRCTVVHAAVHGGAILLYSRCSDEDRTHPVELKHVRQPPVSE